MTTKINRPNPFVTVWAESNNSKKFAVYETASEAKAEHPARASMELGFPEITMKSAMTGGQPPWGQDHNGILYQITKAIQWTQAGGIPQFDAKLVEKINGYPAGTILQGDDPDKPWVLWISTINNNKNNPRDNTIDSKIAVNGWLRYPVISGVDGSSLYYDKEGRLEIASSTVNLERWVSSSAGSDKEGKGTKESPYFSIQKAINDTPGSGAVTIYIRDIDTHYWSPDGKSEDAGGYIYIGSRKLEIKPYDYNYEGKNLTDEDRDTKIYKTIQDDIGGMLNDGNSTFCLSEKTLKELKIARPTIVLVWKYQGATLVGGGVNRTNTQFCGINGVSNDFSFSLYGTRIEINKIEEFNNAGLSLTTGWGWNGGIYQFVGCVFGIMPKPVKNILYSDGKTIADQYLLGGGGDYVTTYSFVYRNFFEDKSNEEDYLKTKFIAFPSNLSINANTYTNGDAYIILDTSGHETRYEVMVGNANDFLSHSNIYVNGLDVLRNPKQSTKDVDSYRYAYINPNFEIEDLNVK